MSEGEFSSTIVHSILDGAVALVSKVSSVRTLYTSVALVSEGEFSSTL